MVFHRDQLTYLGHLRESIEPDPEASPGYWTLGLGAHELVWDSRKKRVSSMAFVGWYFHPAVSGPSSTAMELDEFTSECESREICAIPSPLAFPFFGLFLGSWKPSLSAPPLSFGGSSKEEPILLGAGEEKEAVVGLALFGEGLEPWVGPA